MGTHLGGSNSVKIFCLHSEKVCLSKMIEFAPWCSSFLLEQTPFLKGFMCRKVNRKSQTLSPSKERQKHLACVSNPLTCALNAYRIAVTAQLHTCLFLSSCHSVLILFSYFFRKYMLWALISSASMTIYNMYFHGAVRTIF